MPSSQTLKMAKSGKKIKIGKKRAREIRVKIGCRQFNWNQNFEKYFSNWGTEISQENQWEGTEEASSLYTISENVVILVTRELSELCSC